MSAPFLEPKEWAGRRGESSSEDTRGGERDQRDHTGRHGVVSGGLAQAGRETGGITPEVITPRRVPQVNVYKAQKNTKRMFDDFMRIAAS